MRVARLSTNVRALDPRFESYIIGILDIELTTVFTLTQSTYQMVIFLNDIFFSNTLHGRLKRKETDEERGGVGV